MRKVIGFVLMVMLILQVAGCSESGKNNNKNAVTNEAVTKDAVKVSIEPVTLKIYLNVGLTEKEVQTYYVEPLKKKYPNITLDFVNLVPTKENHINALVASGELPDMVLASTTGIQKFQSIDYVEDLNPLVKKFGMDMNRFDPVTLENLKVFSDKGELVGLPMTMSFAALYYNKDIFDKFGVSYPKDGMNWDDAIALGKKLTRSDGGMRYRGLNPGGADLMGYGLSLPYVDPQTNKAVLETEPWLKVLSKAVEIYSTPGWMDGKLPSGQGNIDFLQLKDTAMLASWTMLAGLEDLQRKDQPLNWDMVTIPNFKEATGYGREVDFHVFMISKNSKYKDQAFQALSFFAGDEVQSILNKNGSLTALKKTTEYQNNFASELRTMKGKNLNAIFSVKPSKLHLPTAYDADARKKIVTAAYDVSTGPTDINTALRTVQEQVTKSIASANQ